MIIIETNTGPVMINDREVRGIEHNKENAEVIVTFANDMPARLLSKGLGLEYRFENRSITIKNVENIFYIGDQCNEKYKYEGGEVESLKKQLEEKKQKIIQQHKLANYLRGCYYIYKNAIDEIKEAEEKKQAGKIFKSIDYIMEQADYKINDLSEEYSKNL